MRLPYFVLIAFLVTGCSNSRFYTKQTITPDVKRETRKVSLQDLTLLSTVEVHNNCLSQSKSTDVGLVLQVYCSSELLTRHDLSAPLKKYAIRLYNNALFNLLKMSDSQGGSRTKVSIFWNIPNQFIFSSEMNALEPRLQPKISGDIGVPIVTFRENTTQGLDLYYPLEGIFNSASIVAREIKAVDGKYQIHFESIASNDNERVIVFDNQSYSLKHSSGAAFLSLLEQANIDDFSWLGFISPTQAEKRRGIFAIGAIDKDKIPLLMIHGLNSDPLIWRYLTMAILNSPKIERKFQIYHIYYPSGPPPFYTAMRTRDNLKQMIKDVNQGFKQSAVIIGHSMGGVIAKLLATKSRNALWQATFTKAPEEVLSKKNAKIKDIFIFEPSYENNTVFFMDTPLKGSETANTLIGSLGSALISLPNDFTQLFQQLLADISPDIITSQMRPLLVNYGPNSVEVLRPGHPLMNTLYDLPLSGESYAIIGSSGDTHCKTKDECSKITDGVVSYDSASYQYAKEKLIVPSSHNSFQTEEAIKFIINKLKKLDSNLTLQ